MTDYITSDPHLGHQRVAELRGYSSVESHNEAWMDSCSALRKGDQLWILGDLTGGGRLAEALNLLGRLPAGLHLVLGNHDQAHPMHRDSHRRMGLYYPTFTSVQLHARKSIAGTRVLLSHYPYTGDRGPDRDTQWRLPDEGRPLLHGHTHVPLALSKSLKGTHQIHVGWDTWHRPVPVELLADFLPTGPCHEPKAGA